MPLEPKAANAIVEDESTGEEAMPALSGLPGASELDAYISTLGEERRDSPHTLKGYRSDLESFLRWAERSELDPLAITRRQARRYLGELDRARYSRNTVNRHLSAIKGFYRWMLAEGLINDDPMSALQGPKRPERLPRAIAGSDMERLLSVHGTVDLDGEPREQTPQDLRDQALLELLYASGLRVSEASGALLKDVDLSQGLIKVMGKGSKERIVPVHRLAVDSLTAYLSDARPKLLSNHDSEYLFVSDRGNRYSEDMIRRMFKKAVIAAGLDPNLSPHSMRHSFATDVLAGGADLRSVQEMLGHASLSTTQVYTHVTPERLGEVHKQAHPRG